MKRFFVSLICLINLLFFPFIGNADQPVTIRVGAYENFPKIFIGDDGRVNGLWADIVNDIGAKEHWQIEWVSGTWTQGLERLKNGEINIMPDTGWTEPRSRQYAFSRETVLVSWSRLYVSQGSQIKSIVDLDGKIIAALKGSFNLEGPEGIKDIIQKFNLKATFRKMDSYQQIFKALEQGKIDAGVTNKDFGNEYEDDYAVARTSIIFQPARMQFSLTKGDDLTPFLIEKIDSHMKKLKTDKNSIYYQSLEKYIGDKYKQTSIEIIPAWVKTVLIICGGAILFLVAVGVIFRIQVRRRTSELRESEQHLRSLLRAAPTGIGMVVDRMLKQVNERICDMTGYSEEDLIDQSSRILYPSDDDYEFVGREKYKQIQAYGTGTVETLWQHKDGHIINVLLSSTPMDITDLTKGVTFTALDITKRKRAEQALTESEERFRMLFDEAPDTIFIINMDDRILDANIAASKMLGYTRKEFKTMTVPDIQPPEVRGEVGFVMKNELTLGKVFEGLDMHKDGTIVPIEIHNHKMVIKDQEIVLSIVRNITERKQSETELKKIEVQLLQAQKMESIGTLAGGIAHDFNNILSGILGYAQLAEINIDNSVKEKEYIFQIIKNTHRAAELVQQILTFSRQSEYQKQPFKIYIGLKEALKLLRSTIPTTIEIKTKIDSKAMALADPTKIHQLIMNLCTNAYHAMRETGGLMTVSLTDTKISKTKRVKGKKIPAGNYFKLEVSDTGHGMDEKTLEKVFDPYFTTKQVGKGTGLGLALVQAIVDEHDGFLNVYSEINKGTNFYIYLPIIRQETEPETSTIKTTFSLKGNEKIMFVDDEESIREITKEFLEKMGYKVSLFENGIEAYKAFEKNPHQFDLTITDMTMPGMAGHKLAAELLKIRPGFPILLCTGFSENISEEKAASIGIKGFLLKPIAMQDLSQKIRKVLDKNKN